MLHLNQNDILVIISILVAFFGIVQATSRIRLYYDFRRATLVEVKDEEIQGHTVVIDGKPAKSLIKTKVFFRNGGNRKFDSSDFSDTMPLRITATRRIFPPADGCQVMAKDPQSIKVKIVDEKTIEVNFTYIKPKHSFAIVVLHDGKLSVSGELTTGKLRFKPDPFTSEPGLVFYSALFFILFVFTEIILVSAYLSPGSVDIQDTVRMAAILLPCMLLVIICLTICLVEVGIVTVKNPFREKNKLTPR